MRHVSSPSPDTPNTDEASTRQAVSRRAALSGLAATAIVGGAASVANAAPRPVPTQAVQNLKTVAAAKVTAQRTLESMVDEASTKFGVPPEVLAAVGFTESMLNARSGQASIDNGFGMMNLVDNPTNRSLQAAARLTGISPEDLKRGDAANILGGAALLRSRADQLKLSSEDRARTEAWLQSLAAHSGARDQAVADEYANQVAANLSTGFSVGGMSIAPSSIASTARLHRVPVKTLFDPRRSLTAPVAKPQPLGNVMPASVSYPAYGGNYASANRPSDYPIQYIVIHLTEGSWSSALNWFQNPSARVSAHYTVRSRDGRIGQSVDQSDIGWHAGNRTYNARSIGIEHEGYTLNPAYLTDAMYRSSAALVRALCDKYGIPKTRDRIVGHNEVPGATHGDPGRHWDWNKYMSYVRATAPLPTWQLVLDNRSPEFRASNAWRGTAAAGKWNVDARFAGAAAVSDAAWFAASIPSNGKYVIECRYPESPSFNDNTPYVISSTAGKEVVYVNQRHLGNQWRSLGTYTLKAGYQDLVAVSRWAKGTGWVVADAIRISRIG